jgi:mono/diheme cytochrome c family protein
MSEHRSIARNLFLTTLFFSLLSLPNIASAQDGNALYKTNCASCHALDKDLTGPALRGVSARWPSRELLHLWIKNFNKAVKTGDAYAVSMAKSRAAVMNVFEGSLTDKDIDAIIDYIDKAPLPQAPGTGVTAAGEQTESSDSALLYGILTLILAVIALILLGVNSNLRKLADDKDGIPASEPVPFYRNKSYITLFALFLVVLAGFFLVSWGTGMGRQKNYQPEQPIYYSHQVHAGTNQINCLYCHGGAFEGKHANIPSVNVCMNCHMTINEYKGKDKLVKQDGTEVNGTEEIKKLYAAAGWDPATQSYTGKGKPIEWIKIHNLPDHVFFSHAQHTKAGKVQCQTCHGEIPKMGEVYQFAELSMGWCVNCHRESKVDFNYDSTNGNKFYSIYEKYHNEIKSKKDKNLAFDSVTVNNIGGLECQKCHY